MSYNRNPCFSQGFKFWMKSFCWSDWPLPACEFAGWSGLAQCAWRGCSFWRGFWSSVDRRLLPPRGLLWCACSAPWCWRYPRRTGGTSENGRNCLHYSSSFSSSFPETSKTRFYKIPAARFGQPNQIWSIKKQRLRSIVNNIQKIPFLKWFHS